MVFLDDLVFMLLSKFVPNSTPLESAVSALFIFIMMLNWHYIECKFVPNRNKELHFLHHDRKFMHIRYHKGAGTKMHKCLDKEKQ